MRTHMLPYFNERPLPVDTLVLHCSAHDTQEMIDVLNHKELSAHYVIGLKGDIVQLVSEDKRAWHAGISQWRGRENLNNNSIGIEISSLSMGQKPYNEKQINSVVSLCREIIERYHIQAKNIVAHSDIAPTRKPDPGAAFPWEFLAQQKIGLWYNLNDASKISENDPLVLLQKIGYDISNPSAAVYAFYRHFIPQEIKIDSNIHNLLQYPYPNELCFDKKYLPILKACCFAYQK